LASRIATSATALIPACIANSAAGGVDQQYGETTADAVEAGGIAVVVDQDRNGQRFAAQTFSTTGAAKCRTGDSRVPMRSKR